MHKDVHLQETNMYISEGNGIKFMILPTKSLRDILVKAIRQRKVKWNYCTTFKDVNGFGVSLSVVDWCKGNETYVN